MFVHHRLQRLVLLTGNQSAVEALGYETGATAGDIDEFADQVGMTRATKSSRFRSMSSSVLLSLAA